MLAWLDAQQAIELHVTAVTVAELGYGVASLPDGARRDALAAAVDAMLDVDLDRRVLPFDHPAAEIYGAIVVGRERRGRPISQADAQIAAVCTAHDATLATRNGRDFAGTGIATVGPWRAD